MEDSDPSSKSSSSTPGPGPVLTFWTRFFISCGIPLGVASEYGRTFEENHMRLGTMLEDIDKELLKEMGIKVVGDVLGIMKRVTGLRDDSEAFEKLVKEEDTYLKRKEEGKQMTEEEETNKSDDIKTSTPPSTTTNTARKVTFKQRPPPLPPPHVEEKDKNISSLLSSSSQTQSHQVRKEESVSWNSAKDKEKDLMDNNSKLTAGGTSATATPSTSTSSPSSSSLSPDSKVKSAVVKVDKEGGDKTGKGNTDKTPPPPKVKLKYPHPPSLLDIIVTSPPKLERKRKSGSPTRSMSISGSRCSPKRSKTKYSSPPIPPRPHKDKGKKGIKKKKKKDKEKKHKKKDKEKKHKKKDKDKHKNTDHKEKDKDTGTSSSSNAMKPADRRRNADKEKDYYDKRISSTKIIRERLRRSPSPVSSGRKIDDKNKKRPQPLPSSSSRSRSPRSRNISRTTGTGRIRSSWSYSSSSSSSSKSSSPPSPRLKRSDYNLIEKRKDRVDLVLLEPERKRTPPPSRLIPRGTGQIQGQGDGNNNHHRAAPPPPLHSSTASSSRARTDDDKQMNTNYNSISSCPSMKSSNHASGGNYAGVTTSSSNLSPIIPVRDSNNGHGHNLKNDDDKDSDVVMVYRLSGEMKWEEKGKGRVTFNKGGTGRIQCVSIEGSSASCLPILQSDITFSTVFTEARNTFLSWEGDGGRSGHGLRFKEPKGLSKLWNQLKSFLGRDPGQALNSTISSKLLTAPETEKYNESGGPYNSLSFGLGAMQGYRKSMEDAYSTMLRADWGVSYFGIFDGHGGSFVANYASDHLISHILKTKENGVSFSDVGVKQAFFAMDEELRSLSQSKELGSTAVVALITEKEIIVANLGDSRAILCSAGKLVLATKDHKPTNTEEMCRIYEAGGTVMEQRINGNLAVSRGFGDFLFKATQDLPPEEQIVSCEPDVFHIPRNPSKDEFLLLASDGVWDVMENEAAILYVKEQLRETRDIPTVCNRLLDTCLEKGSRDNMSVIMVSL